MASVRFLVELRSSNSASVPVSTARPWWSRAMRSQRYSASLMMCVEKRMALPSARFFRIHRSYLVNLQKVSQLDQAAPGRWQVHLSDANATTLEVARRQTRALKQHLGLRA